MPKYSFADEIRVAVASNFITTLQQLKPAFEKVESHKLVIISASTGQLSHQILNGAPFDVFLSANKQHPEMLQTELKQPLSHLFPYAQGSLVLVSQQALNSLPATHSSLTSLLKTSNTSDKTYHELHNDIVYKVLSNANKVAIANHKLAPYGQATLETLTTLNSLNLIKDKTVKGQNISQTHQFFTSGSVDAAFIAKSQLISTGIKPKGMIEIPSKLHNPIEQWALLLNSKQASKTFKQFLMSDTAIQILQKNGYSSSN